MGFAFAKLALKKLFEGTIVSSLKNKGFKKLSTKTPLPTLTTQDFNLGFLIIPPGTYSITVTAVAKGFEESEHSNPVEYTRN